LRIDASTVNDEDELITTELWWMALTCLYRNQPEVRTLLYPCGFRVKYTGLKLLAGKVFFHMVSIDPHDLWVKSYQDLYFRDFFDIVLQSCTIFIISSGIQRGVPVPIKIYGCSGEVFFLLNNFLLKVVNFAACGNQIGDFQLLLLFQYYSGVIV
jgi:hypothetical protein